MEGNFYKGKLVLVTGGTGFIGRHIVEELLNNGAKVRVPIHKRPLSQIGSHIETINANLACEPDCEKVVEGVDYLFHAAGSVGAASVDIIHQMDSIIHNLLLTGNILRAAWRSGVQRVLLFSSSTVYPVVQYPVKEEEGWCDPLHPSYFGYGWMRRYLERLGEFVADKSKVQVAIVRPTSVYGRNDNFDPASSHVIPALIRRAVDAESPFVVWGTGEEVRDFINVVDLARGCLLILEKYAVCDPINLGSAREVTIRELVSIILKAVGHENVKVIFDASKPMTIPFRSVDTEKAKKILGFETRISLETGITDTVQWYKTQRPNRSREDLCS
jgi:GDP-L-fucose synthase